MTTELLQQAAANNQWTAIFPELMVGCLALLLLIFEIVLPKKNHDMIPNIAIAGLLAITAAHIFHYQTAFLDQTTFNGLLKHTGTYTFDYAAQDPLYRALHEQAQKNQAPADPAPAAPAPVAEPTVLATNQDLGTTNKSKTVKKTPVKKKS